MLDEEIVESTQVLEESGIGVSEKEINSLLEDINLKRSKLSKMTILEKELKELKILQDNVKKKYSRIKKLNEQINL